MKKSDYIIKSLINAGGVLLYVSLISAFLFNGKQLFGKEENFLIPIFMLLLFVISAATTGLLVLGKPIYLYLDGFKKEAIILLCTTVGWLILFLFMVAGVLLLR